MKLLSYRYLLLNLDANKSNWTYNVPSGLIRSDPTREKMKIYIKKLVWRSDFEVISSGKSRIKINNQIVNVRQGSPDVIAFCSELSLINEDLKFEFDTYESKLIIINESQINTFTIDPFEMVSITGITAPITVSPQTSQKAQSRIDLAPSESLMFKSDFITNDLQITESGGATSSNILAVIGNNVAPYATGVYNDQGGAYGHFLMRNTLDKIELYLEDNTGVRISSANPITMILAVEIYRDDSGEQLDIGKEQLDVLKLQLLGQDLQKNG